MTSKYPITMDVSGYEPLAIILRNAYLQAAEGKGTERHNPHGFDFRHQPICTIQDAVGSGFALGQALKKTQEAAGMLVRDEPEAAVRELHGAIVYLAAAVWHIEEGGR